MDKKLFCMILMVVQSMFVGGSDSFKRVRFDENNKEIILSFLDKVRKPKRCNGMYSILQEPYNLYIPIENQMPLAQNDFFRAHKKMLQGDHRDLLSLLFGMSQLGEVGYQIMIGCMFTVLKPESISPTLAILKLLSVDYDDVDMTQEVMECLTKYQNYCAVSND